MPEGKPRQGEEGRKWRLMKEEGHKKSAAQKYTVKKKKRTKHKSFIAFKGIKRRKI